MQLPILRLKKNEDRRLRAGHLWIYSNEINSEFSPLKNFTPGQEVFVESYDKTPLGIAFINPHSLIVARLFSRHLNERLDATFLTKKIKNALALRQALFDKPFYRLVFGESDELPGLIVDRFDDTLVTQLNTAGMDLKQAVILDVLCQVLPSTKNILLRNDSPVRLQEGLENLITKGLGNPPEKIQVEENETVFNAPLWSGQKTGWFFDHRLNRVALQKYCGNRRVLDVFSYLGAWGIQAAKAHAKEVTCIDSSKLATEFILENANLNNVQDKMHVICEDAFLALKNLNQRNEKFDVVILDPPAFAKKLKDKKPGFLAYQRLNELALKLLPEGGILASCSCSMHMSATELLQAIRRASLQVGCKLQMLERGHQGPDHPVHLAIPETDYLKMVIARKL